MMKTQCLRVVVERGPEEYVAQCVDFDIQGAGDSPEHAMDEFVRAFIRHVLVAVELGEEPLASTPPPVGNYEDWWESAVGSGRIKPQEFTIPRFAIVDGFDDSTLPHRVEALVA